MRGDGDCIMMLALKSIVHNNERLLLLSPGFVTHDDDDDYSFSLFKSQQPPHALSGKFLEHIYHLDPRYALHMVYRSLMSLANEDPAASVVQVSVTRGQSRHVIEVTSTGSLHRQMYETTPSRFKVS